MLVIPPVTTYGTLWGNDMVSFNGGMPAGTTRFPFPLLLPVQLRSDLHLRFYWYRSHTHTGSLNVQKEVTVFVIAFYCVLIMSILSGFEALVKR